MKLKAIQNFWGMDKKRGARVVRKKDEPFEMDESTEAEDIYFALMAGRVVVVDEKFIPGSWRYICVHSFSYENAEGLQRFCGLGSEVTFSQELACKYLVSGYIKPVDPDGWTPRKLLGPIVKDGEVKKMFDDFPPQKEPWRVRKEDPNGNY
jgi:hypothetical protein